MMPLLWVPVVPVCVRLSVWPKPVSTLLVFPSFSLREVILSPLRVVSTQLSESGCFPLCVPRLVGSLNRSGMALTYMGMQHARRRLEMAHVRYG